VELIKDDRLVVEAFDRHWRGTPKIRRITFKPVPEPFTRVAALRSGELDLITNLPQTWPENSNGFPASRCSVSQHLDDLPGAQCIRETPFRPPGAPGPQLCVRCGRHHQERLGGQRPANSRPADAEHVRV